MKRVFLLFGLLSLLAICTMAVNDPVCNPPSNLSGPNNVTVCAGSSAAFSVTYSGDPPTFQWQESTDNQAHWHTAPGVYFSQTYTIASASFSQNGNDYRVILTGCNSSATSHVAVLTVSGLIITQPSSQTLPAGNNASFTIAATGTSLTYQWMRNGYNLVNSGRVSGATSSNLLVSNLKPWDAGLYTVLVSNPCGTVVSSNAVLIVGVPSNVVAWGYEFYGAIDVPVGLSNIVSVAAGSDYSTALRNDGTVTDWGSDYEGERDVPPDLNNVAFLGGGWAHQVVLKGNGSVVAWGYNAWGQATVPAGLSNAVSVSGGLRHSLAVRNNGTVVGWGDDSSGQATPPPGLTNVVAVAAGGEFSLALKGDGTVIGWGSNGLGQTNVPSGLTNVVMVAAGLAHSLALKSDGTMVAWGCDCFGAGTVPADATNVVAIAAGSGGNHSMALRGDGTVVNWGYPYVGPVAAPIGLTNVTAIASGDAHSVAVGYCPPVFMVQPPSQTVLAGSNVTFHVTVASSAQPISYQWWFNGSLLSGETNRDLVITNLQSAKAGTYYVVATNTIGTVTSSNAVLVCVNLTIPVFNPNGGTFATMQTVAVTCADPSGTIHYTLNGMDPTEADPVVANGGTVLVQGVMTIKAREFFGGVGGPVASANFNITGSIAAGYTHALGLVYDGTVLAAGMNLSGQLGNGTLINSSNLVAVTNLSGVLAIEGGTNFSLALMSGGTVRSWGLNASGQLGDGTSINRPTNVVVTNLTSVSAIAAGASHSLAVLSNGLVRAWGLNGNGQLGDGTTTLRLTNVAVPSVSNMIAVAAGGKHSLGLMSDHTVRGWGANGNGQVGDNSTNERHTGVPVLNLSSVTAIAAGDVHSLALLSDGTVRAWGDNSNGQLGDTTTSDRHAPVVVTGLSNVVQVAGGGLFSLALLSNGTVTAWGDNSKGQLGDGTGTDQHAFVPVVGLSNIVAVSAGYQYSMALQSDGRIWIWGYTNYGIPTVAANFSKVPVLRDPSVHLTYWTGPMMVTQPQSQIAFVGQNIAFNALATSPLPVGYQWYFNDSAIPNGNAATLSLGNVQTNATGNYFVVASNSVGSVTSSVATLTVILPPQITVQPTNQSLTVGSSASFSVTAISNLPLGYQWYGMNSGILVGQANPTLVLNNVQLSSADSYFVVITASFGAISASTTSMAAMLRVRDPAIDADGNGLGDAWENTNFGHTGVDPNADPDGDGLTNLQEYLGGTNPNVADNRRVLLTEPKPASNLP